MFAANFNGLEFSSLVFSLLENLKRRIVCLSYIYCKVPSVSIAIRFYLKLKFGGASVVGNLKMACCVSRTCLEIMLGMVFIFFFFGIYDMENWCGSFSSPYGVLRLF
ncbi:hypothetical protein J1N35_007402 [Gossypium stocksii]|uniref:Uncharacterized protein n=1 Tax=Gossypium stocksii TaxID=47602 RepID=A0A9D3W602_9ROSI|nr:hypothetical protein J1N35_007402 [Gossypium stocksii]